MKDGVLYNNQSRNAGSQYTASATTSATIDNSYSVVNLGTSTAEYYLELGNNVAQGGDGANYLRSSHGNTTSAASITLAEEGTLTAGTYTFELGNYRNRSGIIKVGDLEVGVLAKGYNNGSANSAVFAVTTLDNVVVPEGAVVTAVKGGGSTVTDEIDYFLAIRTGDATVSKTITDAGWATYCSPYILDFSSAISGLDAAYIVTGGSNGVLTKSLVTGAVPANTGLLLKGSEGSVTIPVAATATFDVTDNILEGVTSETGIDAGTGWVLMASPLGFYNNTNAFTVGANTAYIPVASLPVSARGFYALFDDDATGVNDVRSQKEDVRGAYYNLNGQRVDREW